MTWLRLFLILALLHAPFTLAQTELRTIQLHNRSAQEMIDILRPMLDPEGGMSGTGYTLIVRSTPQNLSEIEQMVRELDTALHNLIISVRRDSNTNSRRREIGAQGEVPLGKGKVIVGEGGAPRLHLEDRTQRNRNDADQTLRVLEGQWARIQTGQEMAVPQRNVYRSGGNVIVQETTSYHTAASGFEVRPQLSGNNVTVEVRPFRNQPQADGTISTEGIHTTVSGRLGEWLELGGVSASGQSRSSGIAQRSDGSETQRMRTYIRIELAQ